MCTLTRQRKNQQRSMISAFLLLLFVYNEESFRFSQTSQEWVCKIPATLHIELCIDCIVLVEKSGSIQK